jgi:anaerobic magnesium-protoporphyrin IX monomethyl ester cyclase
MARVAFVKVFTGMNLAVSQLAAELLRAGHETRIIYFKDYITVPQEEAHLYPQTDLCGVWIAARAREMNCNCYKPFTEREFELLRENLEEFRPDLIAMNLTSVPMRECAEVTRRIKEWFDIPVIWGGSGPTIEPERAIEHCDMICVGEGEELIVELADALDAGRDYSNLRNLWIRKDGQVIRNEGRPLIDIEKIAIPDYDPRLTYMINDDRIRSNLYPSNLGRQYTMMTQRGCPYSCSFCVESYYQEKWGHSVRRRSVDVVIEELVLAMERYGVKAVLFYDDVFTIHPKWLREFAPRYKAEVGLPFWCYTYPRTTRKEDILLLKDAGLATITVGIQSGSREVLKAYNRPIDDSAIRAAEILEECGVDAFFDLITQSEVETEATCRETFEFLLRLPTHMKTVGFYPMIKFANYAYTNKVQDENLRFSLTPDDYRFWHKMYLLTRTNLPREQVRRLATSPEVRKNPDLVDELLPDTLPFFFLEHYAIDLEEALGHDRSRPMTDAGVQSGLALTTAH